MHDHLHPAVSDITGQHQPTRGHCLAAEDGDLIEFDEFDNFEDNENVDDEMDDEDDFELEEDEDDFEDTFTDSEGDLAEPY